MARLGVYDTPRGRAMLRQHFDQVVKDKTNVTKTSRNRYGFFEDGESVFVGPGGSAKFTTSWQVMPDGTRRFTTIIPKGRGPL